MDIAGYLSKALDIVFLNRRSIRKVASDKNATLPAILMLIITLLLSEAVFAISEKRNAAQIAYDIAVGIVILVLLFYALTHILARAFGSRGKFIAFFRSNALASILGFIEIIALVPQLLLPVYIIELVWSAAIYYAIVSTTYKLGRGKTVAILVIIFALFFSLSIGSIVLESRLGL